MTTYVAFTCGTYVPTTETDGHVCPLPDGECEQTGVFEEDDEQEYDHPLCVHGYNPVDCRDPGCNGNTLLSEVRDAELWGGTE